MPLQTGQKLGSYEVLGLVGTGGQGEVYKARDTRLDRTVAIKVMPEHLAQLPELRERFEREARVVSSLNHPRICTLFDVGRHEGADFLVMEYVEGETLETRLARGPLPLEQAVRYAIDIADALAAAHRASITHRDLKPGNVMLTKSGPKLLDFGLAKTQPAAASFDSQSAAPTRAALTAEGTILGTLQYLSPEQIEGKDADTRTDIFAFGAMLYEMVIGKKAFEGKSQVSVLAAILEHDPQPMSAIQTLTPPALEHLVQRCLEKDPDQRWQSALDIQHELRWILQKKSVREAAAVAPARRPWGWMAATALCLAVAIVSLVVRYRSASSPQSVLKYSISLPKHGQTEGLFFNFHMSPDGRSLAVHSALENDFGIFVRQFDYWDYRLVPTNNEGDFFWSPDSRYFAYFDNRKLKKVNVGGGPPEDICNLPGYIGTATGSWGSAGVILVSSPTGGPLLRIPAAGGEAKPVTAPVKDTTHLYPAFLPDGQHFLYMQKGGSTSGIYIASLDNPAGRRLLSDESSAHFSPPSPGQADAHLIFIRDGKLMAQRFDQRQLELLGDAFVLADRAVRNESGSAGVSISDNGMLSYWAGRNRETDSRVAWFDRGGHVLSSETDFGPPRPISLSPDGQKAAVFRSESTNSDGDLWVRDLSRGAETRITFGRSVDNHGNAIWSPDSMQMVFSSGDPAKSDAYRSTNLYLKDLQAPGEPEPILAGEGHKVPTDWSRDGYLVYSEITPKTGSDIWYVRLDRTGKPADKPVPFLQTEFDETFAQISPDGRWILYLSNEASLRHDVYIRPFPSGAAKWRISSSAGIVATQQPRWNPNGKEIFYLTGSPGEFVLTAVSVTVSPSGALEIGTPKPLFKARENAYAPISSTLFYSVGKDGQRFLIDHVDSTVEPVVNVIVNWRQAFPGSR